MISGCKSTKKQYVEFLMNTVEKKNIHQVIEYKKKVYFCSPKF